VSGERAEEWVPVKEAFRRVEAYERDGRTIDGLEAARITDDERVLFPALADFTGCDGPESWAFARRLLSENLPNDATHVCFSPE
jgi:hypothetical protein